LRNSKFIKLIDFGSYMVFDSASIQTMIMQFEKTKRDDYTFDYRKIIALKPNLEDALNVINDTLNESIEVLKPTILIENFIDKGLTFNSNVFEDILDKVKNKSNFELDEKLEVAQGIVFPQDFIN